MKEVFDEVLPQRSVGDLGVPLNPIESPVRILHGRDWSPFGMGQNLEALRGLDDSHTMAHPDILTCRGILENPLGGINRSFRLAILTQGRLVDPPAQFVSHDLEAVADTQHRYARFEDALIDGGGAVHIHRGRSAREDDGLGVLVQHLIH